MGRGYASSARSRLPARGSRVCVCCEPISDLWLAAARCSGFALELSATKAKSPLSLLQQLAASLN